MKTIINSFQMGLIWTPSSPLCRHECVFRVKLSPGVTQRWLPDVCVCVCTPDPHTSASSQRVMMCFGDSTWSRDLWGQRRECFLLGSTNEGKPQPDWINVVFQCFLPLDSECVTLKHTDGFPCQHTTVLNWFMLIICQQNCKKMSCFPSLISKHS